MLARLQKKDLQMVREYQKRNRLATHDPRVIFRTGDRVLLRRRQPGKMKSRAEGPFTFVKYKTTAGWVAVVEGVGKRTLEVSAANLIPLKGMQQLPHISADIVWQDPPPPT